MALWVKDLENTRLFYQKYFQAEAGERYVNNLKQFTSYMLTFEDGGQIEIMNRKDVAEKEKSSQEFLGWAHIAIGTGSKEKVLELTETLRRDGFKIASEPRVTGDGFFESVVLDPEGNRVEITI